MSDDTDVFISPSLGGMTRQWTHFSLIDMRLIGPILQADKDQWLLAGLGRPEMIKVRCGHVFNRPADKPMLVLLLLYTPCAKRW